MNDDRGEFVKFLDEKHAAQAQKENQKRDDLPHDIFRVGEEVMIKNSRFRVDSIGKKFMRLRLLPTQKGA